MAQIKLKINKNIFNSSFLPLLQDNTHDILLLLGGGGSGKSYFSFQRAVIRCIMDKRKYLITRRSAVDLERSCWADVLAALDFFQIKGEVSINKTLKSIEFPNGSLMLFMGLDDEQKVKSIPNITDIIIEECSEITLDTFSQLKQRLRGSGALRNQLILQCNPVSKANWVYKHFFDGGCKETNCLIHHSTYKDNRFLNQTTINALEDYKTTNPYFYRIYCLGEWGSLSKQIFTNYEIRDLDLNNLRTKGYTHLVGLDFGFVNDPTTIICSLLDEDNKTLYIYNEFYETGLLNNEISAQLKLMGLEKTTIIADSAEQKSIEEIKRDGIRRITPARKGKDSVIQGIQKLQQYKIVVSSECAHTIEELESYCWKKDRASGEYINEPIDKFNHCIDALRYSLQCAKPKLRTLPSNVL